MRRRRRKKRPEDSHRSQENSLSGEKMRDPRPAACIWILSLSHELRGNELFKLGERGFSVLREQWSSVGSAVSAAAVVGEKARLIAVGVKLGPCRRGSGEDGKISWNGSMALYVISTR